VTEDDTIEFARTLPGVYVMTASAETGAPESAWEDSFIFYDPDDVEEDRRFPFASIVVSDYEGFDTLLEPEHRRRPAQVRRTAGLHAVRAGTTPRRVRLHRCDALLPHPAYATHAWVSIVNPSQLDQQAKDLLVGEHELAVKRHPTL